MLKKIIFGSILLLLVIILIYTRFANLSWGLPYPFHPDERNMAWTLMKLSPGNLFKPDFFAYGQFPLYLSYLITFVLKFFDGDLITPINFQEAIVSLRIISALSSIMTVIFLLKITQLLLPKIKSKYLIYGFFFLIFIPSFIQFSHFGTTESLLMFLYSAIFYFSLKIISDRELNKNSLFLAGLCGLAIATKLSSIIFIILPFFSIIYHYQQVDKKDYIMTSYYQLIKFSSLVLIVSIIFSPYNFISFLDFLGSMKYESDVALGRYMAFYTRQFTFSVPILFQLIKVFPYVLGWPVYFLFILGFIFLPKNKNYNLLRISILVIFLPNSFLYAKWTRFIAPIIPLMAIIAFLFIINIYQLIEKKIIKKQTTNTNYWYVLNINLIIILVLCAVPGISFLNIYTTPDVRYVASNWIYNNIPDNEFLLFETANVIDVPIPNPLNPNPNRNYQGVSFNHYYIDADSNLKEELNQYINKTNYIIVPSRRVFVNHTCIDECQMSNIKCQKENLIDSLAYLPNRCAELQKQYPILNDYYNKLFSEQLGFKKVAEFSSYPKISIFGKTILEFPDEQAEEGWTVFDHPVIRIYKKI